MTLQEAIEYIQKATPADDPWTMWDICEGGDEPACVDEDEAIATILNAVVKGELKR